MKSTIVTKRLVDLHTLLGVGEEWVNWGTKLTIAQMIIMTKNLKEAKKVELTKEDIERFEKNEVKKILFDNEENIVIYRIGTKICLHKNNVYQRLL